MAKKAVEARIWKGGPIRLMASADGYVMVRRPGKLPFVLSNSDWVDLPLAESGAGEAISPRMLRAASDKQV
jgi:hypothetical protein